MSKEKMVKVKLLRVYSRGNARYSPGKVIRVPDHVAKAMEAANPPYGKRVEEAGAKAEGDGASTPASAPKAAAKPASASK